jgi:UDP-glucuronate 4-epimerase
MPDALLKDTKLLIVGCSSQVALPVANALAADNQVFGIARFKNRFARRSLEAAGVKCEEVDLEDPDLSALPTDFDYVLNFAVARSGDWSADLDSNVGSIGFVMEHCREARAMLHCSTSAVYQPKSDHVFTEDDPLGDNHRVWEDTLPFLSTYSISKIAAEAMVRFGSKRWGLPAIICRLCVPYGDNGGWPSVHLDMMRSGVPIEVHPDRPNRFSPIHEDDIIASIPALLAAADTPPPVVNWGGEISSLEDWCGILAKLTGITPQFTVTDKTIGSVPCDVSMLRSLVGTANSVSLEDGLARMIAARNPELLLPQG